MILGTVQLGMKYGMNNKSGKPDKISAMNILDYSYQNGIKILDTASAYGDSEEVIGDYIKSTGNIFQVCTKLPVQVKSSEITDYFEKSKRKLGSISQFYVYYLHRFEQCTDREIIKQLVKLREKRMIENIGISIYEPKELQYILDNLCDIVDVIQFPFNMLDNERWMRCDLLNKAKDKGIMMYARSIYLQGFLVAKPSSEHCKKLGLTEKLKELHKIAEEEGYSIEQLAVNYVYSMKQIEDYLVGCETTEQLQNNIDISKHATRLDDTIQAKICQISSGISQTIIDPRKWGD